MDALDTECYWGRHKFEKGLCTRKGCCVDQNNLIEIHANRWFNKTYGNTYHKVYITLPTNPPVHHVTDIHYGYGEQFKQTALDAIAAHLLLTKDDYPHLSSFLSRNGYWALITVADVQRKKDM